MRILHLINHCAYANGNVHAAVDLACAQAISGRDVFFASDGGDFEDLLRQCGVKHIQVAQNLRQPTTALRAIARLCGIQRKLRADVLHAHMMSGALIGYIVSRITGSSLVTTVHNSHDWHARVMNLGDAVVAVSQAECRRLAADGFRKKALCAVWNGPLGSPRYPPNEESAPLRRKTILSICGLHPRKGLADLLDAFAQIAAEHQDWSLVIGGEGPDEDTLLEQCRRLGIAHRTTFLGKVRDPLRLMRAAEIFVIPSRAEPFGLTAVEARSAGCAIVGTRVGGIPEILDFGAAGILVEAGQPDAIARALRLLVTDEPLRARYQARAIEQLDIFGTDRLVEDYDTVYKRALGAHADAGPLRTAQPSLSYKTEADLGR